MAEVYDNAAQKIVDVPASEATIGLREGRYSATGRVRVTRDDGELGTIDPSELSRALDSGFRIVDDAEVQTIRDRREAESTAGILGGTGEAVLAGATLGGSTWVEANVLGLDPAGMRARREAAGTLADVGEVGGAVVPAILSGGGSTAAQAGGSAARLSLAARVARATPTGVATRIGARAEQGLAARMATSRIVPSAGRNAIEGAATSIGAEIDESVLGERELAADRIAAAGLMGGIFGTGAAVGVHGLAKVATGAARTSIAGMRKVLGRENAASGGLASREVAEMVADSPVRSQSMQSRIWESNAVAQGVDPETAARLARMGDSAEGRADILRLERDRPKIEREAAELIAERVPRVHASMDEARRLANGESKAGYWERLGPKTPEAQRAAVGEASELRRIHAGELEDLAAQNRRARDEFGGGLPYNSTILVQYRDALARFERELVDANQLSGKAVSTKVAMAADRYKRELGNLIDDNGGWGRARHVDPDVRQTNAVMRQRYKEVQAYLERSDLHGAAAEAQAKINNAYSRFAAADSEFKDATAGTGLGTIVNPDGTVNAQKALKLVRAHGRTGGDVVVARLMDALDARVSYFDEISRHVDLDDAGRSAIAQVKTDVAALRSEFQRQASDAGKLDDLLEARRVEGNSSPSLLTTGTSLASLVGFGIGGPIGAIGGAALVAARQPHTTLHRYASIMSALDKTDSRLGGVVKRMFRSAASIELPKLKAPRVPIGTIAGSMASRSREENTERREKALARAGEFLVSADAIDTALSVPLYDVADVAPGVASVIQQRVQVAAKFLESKAPKVYARGKTRLVDPVSAASFERYLEAVADPIAALERFDAGRLTGETAEAIRVVYPALYADVQQRIQAEMAEAEAAGREFPYSTRIRLGQLFGVATDPSLRPAAAFAIQTAIGADYDEPDSTNTPQPERPRQIRASDSTSKNNLSAADRTADWKNA